MVWDPWAKGNTKGQYKPKEVTHCGECHYFSYVEVTKLAERFITQYEAIGMEVQQEKRGRIVYIIPHCNHSLHRGMFHELSSKESNIDFLREHYMIGCKDGTKSKFALHRTNKGVNKRMRRVV